MLISYIQANLSWVKKPPNTQLLLSSNNSSNATDCTIPASPCSLIPKPRVDDQIIEIAFCDSDRHVIIDTLIYTDRPSSPGAFKVHGIHPHELLGKPTFIDIQPAIVQLLKGRTLYAYNASLDIRMMRQSGHKLWMQQVDVKCLAKQFANFIGQYSPYFKSNRYFSLSKACLHFGVEHTNAHRAAADAIACVTVWEGMMTSHHWDY